jgi:hypothetical protein
MSYCPENLKFNLSYTLHSNIKRDESPLMFCNNTYPSGVNESRNLVLHYAGQGPFNHRYYGLVAANHYWTGQFKSVGLGPGQTDHYLFLNSEGDLELHIDDLHDPLLTNSFPPYIGAPRSEGPHDGIVAPIIYNNCGKDSDGNLLTPCTGPSTNTAKWFEGYLLISGAIVGVDSICRQYISPTITQIGSCESTPNPLCTIANGHFTIQRDIATCGPSQASAESAFDAQVSAGAFDVKKETKPSVISPSENYLDSDFLINKNLYDTAPLKVELNRLMAKLKHYAEVINCRADSDDSVRDYHLAAVRNLSEEFVDSVNVSPTPRLSPGGNNSFKFYGRGYLSAKNLGELAERAFGVYTYSSHLFIVDPNDDSKVHHFMILDGHKNMPDNRQHAQTTRFDPARSAGYGDPERNIFLATLNKYIKIVSDKMDKIKKYLDEDFSFCSEIEAEKNRTTNPKYVFEGLTYKIEIEYNEISYLLNDCKTKTITSTVSRTKTLNGQTFSPDKIINVNID